MRRARCWGLLLACCGSAWAQRDVSLNGAWEMGLERHYTQSAQVPGLAQDPTKSSPGTVWFRRQVRLPGGNWTQASLTLNGARFAPQVYVDGERVSQSEGGMAPTVHVLRSAHVRPGATVTLEMRSHHSMRSTRRMRRLFPRRICGATMSLLLCGTM